MSRDGQPCVTTCLSRVGLGLFDLNFSMSDDWKRAINFPTSWTSTDFLTGREWWINNTKPGSGGNLENYLETYPFENYEVSSAGDCLIEVTQQEMTTRFVMFLLRLRGSTFTCCRLVVRSSGRRIIIIDIVPCVMIGVPGSRVFQQIWQTPRHQTKSRFTQSRRAGLCPQSCPRRGVQHLPQVVEVGH